MAAGERNAFALKFVALQTIYKRMLLLVSYHRLQGFPGALDGTKSACNAGDLGLIPGSERSPGEGSGSSLQYSCLENPKDRGAWGSTVHGVTKSQTQLSN